MLNTVLKLKNVFCLSSFLLLSLVAFSSTQIQNSQTQTSQTQTPSVKLFAGKVINIADGDTITVLDDHKISIKIRLLGIDCPEKSQAFGHRAKKALSDKIFSQRVNIHTHGKDYFGRTLGVVTFNDEDINEWLLTEGLAWHFKKYAKSQTPEDAKRYSLAQADAQRLKRGLWADEKPIPPWIFRDQQKKSSQ